MKRSHVVAAGVTLAAGVAAFLTVPAATAAHKPGYEPVLNPADFVKVIDNPYFPLPVGRTLIYRGIKDGRSQIDRVHVTSKTKKIEGITATTVTDVRHRGKLLEDDGLVRPGQARDSLVPREPAGLPARRPVTGPDPGRPASRTLSPGSS